MTDGGEAHDRDICHQERTHVRAAAETVHRLRKLRRNKHSHSVVAWLAHHGDVHMLAPESVLAWIIIGAIAGWLAGLLVKGYGFGLIGNIVIGILGAGIAGILAPALGLYTQSAGGNIVAATVGALILLFLIGLVRRV
jgi:uncharacterized membrane protein YeaQ/YmgE (transglycosylase-associated protein family)